MEDKKRYALTMPADIYNAVKAAAQKQGISMNAYILLALSAQLRRDQKNQ